ncbi:acyl-CoA thioesterase [Streptomyces sp. NPDC042319]|uniref:acyl-CoA thioesterase n=1 Tax=Streptomyces sp. NPDC042319 TaxID=3154332 RepID=UPI0033E0341E
MTFDETNLAGNVYFAHYVHWQGHCREHFLADYAPEVVRAMQEGEITLVTTSCDMDFYAECFALHEVSIAMTLRTRSANRLQMTFDYQCGSKRIAHGSQTVACLRRTPSGALPIPIPDELTTALDRFEEEGECHGT